MSSGFPPHPSALAHHVSRREFLQAAGAALAASGITTRAFAAAGANQPLIKSIERQTIFRGREVGKSWFHPRACMRPDGKQTRPLMTLQTIGGSDYFGPVHWTSSEDFGRTWSEPQPIPGLGRRELPDGQQEGVCDVVPEYHAATNTVLAMGHNVYYRNGVLARPQGPRWPVYVVRKADGSWTDPRKLVWDDPRGATIYTCGCAQRVTLDSGELLVPLSFGPEVAGPRSVTAVLCSFDGDKLAIQKTGNELKNAVGRGLLEPSLARFGDRYYMTIRAEDQRGYVSVSDDGLSWREPQAWQWDDGQPLVMSTTQQRWLSHSDGLFLVYTRQSEQNAKVIRFRAPLYVAQVDPDTLRLRRDTEQVVLPLLGDGVNDPKHVALMGNFHTVAASPDESWVTVGENRPYDRFRGDALMARIHWKSPNQLALPVSS